MISLLQYVPSRDLQGPQVHLKMPLFVSMSSSTPMLSYRTRSSRIACFARSLCVDVGLDGSLESLGVGTNDLGDLVTALEKEEGGHGADTEFLRNIGDLVDVELVEARVGVCAGEPFRVLEEQKKRECTVTHLTTWGAMTLQGPHQVAKQSRTIRLDLSASASSNAALLSECQQLAVETTTSPIAGETWDCDIGRLTSGGCVRRCQPFCLCLRRTWG